MNRPGLSVVLPTLARRDTLDECLRRLAAQSPEAGPFEVVVGADAAVDDLPALARRVTTALGERGSTVQATRPGASAARNAAWRAATAPVIVFVDDDVLADPGLLAAHRTAHEREPHESVGVLGALRWAAGLEVTPLMRWLEDGVQFDYVALEGRDETGWWHLYTCNASVKRSLLERVGGFDERGFPFGFEDLDLGRRLDAAAGGLRLIYRRDASAEHDHPMTLEQWRERVKRIAWSERRFVARYPDAEPAFHTRMAAAAGRPAVRGRGARLAGIVPRATPWLGPRVHGHAELWFAQQLAAPFLTAWEEAADEDPGPPPRQPR